MQVKVCGKKLHTKIDIRNEMPDLICGRITAGEKYILTHDKKRREEKRREEKRRA